MVPDREDLSGKTRITTKELVFSTAGQASPVRESLEAGRLTKSSEAGTSQQPASNKLPPGATGQDEGRRVKTGSAGSSWAVAGRWPQAVNGSLLLPKRSRRLKATESSLADPDPWPLPLGPTRNYPGKDIARATPGFTARRHELLLLCTVDSMTDFVVRVI